MVSYPCTPLTVVAAMFGRGVGVLVGVGRGVGDEVVAGVDVKVGVGVVVGGFGVGV